MDKVYYSQKDRRWASLLYSNHRDPAQNISSSGCGPTCFAMAASSFLGRAILPPETCKFSTDNGFRTENDGTSWSFFSSAAKQYGLISKQTGSLNEVKTALAEGKLVIASMRFGHFTKGGHYILLVGIRQVGNDTVIDVFDPNMDNRNYGLDGLIIEGVKDDGKVSAFEKVFVKEAAQYWIISGGVEMSKEDGLAIVQSLQKLYQVTTDKKAQQEIHRQADVVRKAAGLPTS